MLCVCNVTVNVLFGKHYKDMNDPQLLNLVHSLQQFRESILQGDAPSIIPFLPTDNVKRAEKAARLFFSYVSTLYDEYSEKLTDSEPADHFSYLIKASNDPNILKKNGIEKLTRDNIEGLIVDLLFGAIDTVTSKITWLMLRLLHYPQYMKDALEVIRSVVGIHQYPVLKDRACFFTKCLSNDSRISEINHWSF